MQKVVSALSAMSTSRKLSLKVDLDPAHRSIIAQQTMFALKQYQKALKEMRVSLQMEGDSRKALMACLLVCCFESLSGSTASAHAHAVSDRSCLSNGLPNIPMQNSMKLESPPRQAI